jgi:hypothetical protein
MRWWPTSTPRKLQSAHAKPPHASLFFQHSVDRFDDRFAPRISLIRVVIRKLPHRVSSATQYKKRVNHEFSHRLFSPSEVRRTASPLSAALTHFGARRLAAASARTTTAYPPGILQPGSRTLFTTAFSHHRRLTKSLLVPILRALSSYSIGAVDRVVVVDFQHFAVRRNLAFRDARFLPLKLQHRHRVPAIGSWIAFVWPVGLPSSNTGASLPSSYDKTVMVLGGISGPDIL